jgi:hypothetical protein
VTSNDDDGWAGVGGDTAGAHPSISATDLEEWFRAVLSDAHPLRIGSALRRAERAALRRFPASQVASAVHRAIAAMVTRKDGSGPPGESL